MKEILKMNEEELCSFLVEKLTSWMRDVRMTPKILFSLKAVLDNKLDELGEEGLVRRENELETL